MRAPHRRLTTLLLPLLIGLGLAIAFGVGRNVSRAATKPKVLKKDKKKQKKEAEPEPPKKAEVDDKAEPKKPVEYVDVGIYLHHIPAVDLKTNTYLADFYIWFHWKGDIDPTKTFEFTNAVETWDLNKVAVYNDDDGVPKTEEIPDGSKYQVFHVHGRFVNAFKLQNYPFDEQDIVIRVEDAEYQTDQMVYRVDTGGAKHHPGIELPGWELAQSSAIIHDERYGTNFGDPRVQPSGDVYTQFIYSLHIVRPVKGYLIKTLLPIAIVIAIAFIVFMIPPRYFEGRLGLAITNLISAVALQLSTGSDLPSVGYLVLLDKIYNLAYLVIFGSLVESVLVTRVFDSGREVAARRIDRWSVFALFVLISVGLAYILKTSLT